MALWLKAWHIVFMVTYFAGAFYLPRLFVYHAECSDAPGNQRFKIMEYKLYWYIMTPSLLLMSGFGGWMLYDYAWMTYKHAGWLHGKLLLVACLYIYHIMCGWILMRFARDQNRFSSLFLRVFNELPGVVLIGSVLLVVVKPW